MGQFFGTGGVRVVAGQDLPPGIAMGLSAAAASVLAGSGEFAAARDAHRRPVAVVGRDPRASGEFLEAAVVAGLAASGVDTIRLGVLPTPAVAYLTAALAPRRPHPPRVGSPPAPCRSLPPRRARRRPGRDAARQPQSGTRQRDQ